MAASTEVLTQAAAYLDFRNESTLLWVIFKSAKTLRSEPSFSNTVSKRHFRLFRLKASEQCCWEEKVPAGGCMGVSVECPVMSYINQIASLFALFCVLGKT